MNERRIQRIQELIKQRIAEVVAHELSDPRQGMITITRVEVDREMQGCEVFWSVLGDEKVQRLNEYMLRDATSFVQREVAAILHTRTMPRLKFHFDQGVEGAQRIDRLLADIRRERGETEPASTDEQGDQTGDSETGDDETSARE